MPKARQKQIAIVAGAALALFLLYRYYQSRQANASTAAATGTAAPDTSASDFASLAGQEQSDVAALQGQNTDLLGQIQGLGQQISAIPAGAPGAQGDPGPAGAPGADATANGPGVAIGALPGRLPTTPQAIKLLNATRKPNTGHYVIVKGKPQLVHAVGKNQWAPGPPPKAKPTPHPSAPRNTGVAHPNTNHTQQGAAYTPSKTHAMPKPAPPAPKTKPKVSGRRK